MVYVLNPVKFREFIAEMKMDKEKAASLKVRPSGMGGSFRISRSNHSTC